MDNVPLVSYLVLRGRCRACGVAIPWRYPLVEALAIALGALVLWQLGPTWDGLRVFLLCLAMIATAFTDLETRRIPDRITLPGVVAACILAPEGLSRGSAGAALGAIVFALVRAARARRAAALGTPPRRPPMRTTRSILRSAGGSTSTGRRPGARCSDGNWRWWTSRR